MYYIPADFMKIRANTVNLKHMSQRSNKRLTQISDAV